MRLFLAIALTDEARYAIAHHLREALPHPLPGRPVRPENWHVTVRFLGEVDEVGCDLLTREVDAAGRGPAFALRWGGLGAFPRPRRATVLWLGVERGEAEAERLAAVVEEAVEAAGFPHEDRPFRCHLTLSRIRPDQDVTAVLDEVPPLGLPMPVDRVVLYRSHLGPGGPRYEEIEAFALGMTVVALHGFTQRGTMWGEVASLAGAVWLDPDLPGHGVEPACAWEEAVAGIAARLEALAPPRHLVGYSMGGRLALAVALAHPALVDGLALVSASPGIGDPGSRRRRRSEDQVLADHLEEVGTSAFVDEWLARPAFAGLLRRPAEWREADRAARESNDPAGLAGALRRLGQGSQPYLGDRLGGLAVPVLLVAGEEDERYAALAAEMGGRIPRAEVLVVPGAGHAVVGERPGALAPALVGWMARR